MRKFWGVTVLVLGVGGLAYWGAKDHSMKMEDKIGDAAAEVVAGSTHQVTTEVAGRDITARGIADTDAEKRAIIAALNDVPGRRVVRDELTVLPVSSPYVTAAAKAAGQVTLTGSAPSDALRATLLGGDAQALTLASGAPEGWADAMNAGLAALAPLDSGTLALRDRVVTLNGTAATPAEEEAARAALAALPEGYAQEVAMTVLDDGSRDTDGSASDTAGTSGAGTDGAEDGVSGPVAFDLTYNASTGVGVTGVLPRDLGQSDIGTALGVSRVVGDAQKSSTDDADSAAISNALDNLSGWLPQMDLATISYRDGQTSVLASLAPGADAELVAASLAESMPGARIEITPFDPAEAPGNGTTRINAASGVEEVFTRGYWLPKLDFAPSPETCNEKSVQSLTETRINFVTGSARLDPQAIYGINRLSAIALKCSDEIPLRAEIGGHTDSTGNPDANDALSLDRANAVRDALAARGVDTSRLMTAGYGSRLPVADNDTEEGRAANRRTTVKWSPLR